MAALKTVAQAAALVLPALDRGEVVLFVSPARDLAVPLCAAVADGLRAAHRSFVLHTPAGSDSAIDDADRNPARGRLNGPVQIVCNATQVNPAILRKACAAAHGLFLHAVSWDVVSAAGLISRRLHLMDFHYSLALTVDLDGQHHRAFPPTAAQGDALYRGAA